MKLFEIKDIMLESFPLAKKEFSQNNPPEEVNDYLERFRSLGKQNKLKGEEKDINFWRKHGFEALKTSIERYETSKTKTQLKKGKDQGDGVTLIDDDTYKVIIPMDFACSRFHGKDTNWCVTKPNTSHFSEYVFKNNVTLIYVINKKTQDKQAIAFAENDGEQPEWIDPEEGEDSIYEWKYGIYELFAKDDERLSPEQFTELNGFVPTDLINLSAKHQKELSKKFQANKKTDPHLLFKNRWNKWEEDTSKRDLELEQMLLKTENRAKKKRYVILATNPPIALLKQITDNPTDALIMGEKLGPLGKEIENIFLIQGGNTSMNSNHFHNAAQYAMGVLKKSWLAHGRPDIHENILASPAGNLYRATFGITE